MRKLLKLISFGLILSFFITGCASSTGSLNGNTKQNVIKGKKLYTQCNMHAYRGKVDTVNYSVGMFIPVNSEVSILGSNRNKIKFDYNGKIIILNNRKKYSGANIKQIFYRYFGKKKVNLNKFNKLDKKAIENGIVTIGMSKKAVLVSLGYPPASATPNLKLNQWRYWKNRWNTILVFFKNDKVIRIKN